VVVDVKPAPGDEAPPDAPVEITFSEPVDPASVQGALSISPRVPGDIQVDGPVVRFRPRTPFPRASLVTVRVGESVKATNGLPILRPVYYRYLVQSPLQVSRHSPRDKEQSVSITSTIQLAFNHPMVTMELTNQPMAPPPWLQAKPAVQGHVRWVGTSLLEFSPERAFRSGTTYTVTVAPPLEALDKAPLTQATVFTFTTEAPRVTDILLSSIEGFVWPDKPMTVTFNMPMDEASAQGNVVLRHQPDASPVDVALKWVDTHTLQVTPRAPLHLGEKYTLIVAKNMRALDGASTLITDERLHFTVVPPIQVGSTEPVNGATGVVPGPHGVRIDFLGVLDEHTLDGNLHIIPKPTEVFTYATRTRLWIRFTFSPRTTYTLTLGAGIGDAFGYHLGKALTFHFSTGDYSPSYRVALPWGAATFEAGRPVSVTVQGLNMQGAVFTLYRPDPDTLPNLVGMEPWALAHLNGAQLGNMLSSWSVRFPAVRNKWHSLSTTLRGPDGRPIGAGIYILDILLQSGRTLKSPPHQRYFIVVTPYNVLLKSDQHKTLVWVTDLRTGKPVPGKSVSLIAGKAKATLVTDEHGLAQVPLMQKGPWERVVALVSPSSPEGLAVSEWQDGISPWDFHLSASYQQPFTLVAYVQTERPVYRPGQTIHWKMIVRQDNDGVYELPPPGTEVNLTVQDPNGDSLLKKTVTLNEMGTASGDIPLDKNASLGFYNVWVEGAEPIGAPIILVAAYRKPEFEISVQATPKEVVAGESARVTANAHYFFGAPVANARVEYVVLDEPYMFQWSCPQQPCPPYSFSDTNWWEWEPFRPTGMPIARGQGRTDAQGNFSLTLPTSLKEKQGSRRWKVEVTVHDVSGQVISGRTYVVVHKAQVYPGIAARGYVAPVNTATSADLILVDTQGHPIPRGDVTFIALRETWHNVRQRGSDGVYRWLSKVEETPVYTSTVHLDDRGRGSVTFTPTQGGTYRLRVVARDSQQRTASASTFLWVSSSTYVSWRRENNNRLFLVPDKTSYRVGETAHVLVPSPYKKPTRALVTLERGSIRRVWTITLHSNSETIDVPISEDMAPNVFLSVFIVQGGEDAIDGNPSFRLGYAELDVDIASRRLHVSLTSEHEKYRPRDVARFTVAVKDSQGQPVDAEVALALVDKAVLSLFKQPTPLVDVFYRKRGLGVITAVSLVKKPSVQRQREEFGGKGGGGGGGGPAPTVREEFLDVAYWKPDVRTGPQGQAVIEARLPDNLTTWTLLAWAVDAQTRVGQSRHDILVTQDFLLRPVLPRFFTRGDRADVGVVAHNLSRSTLRARVAISITGATLVGSRTREIVLAPGQKEKITWSVRDVVGPTFVAFWQGTTDVAGIGDAVRITLPVRYPAPPDVVATAGMVGPGGSRLEVVALPPHRVQGKGTLRLDLDASLAAGMLDSLTYLRHYPWECSEQTVSRFLPNVVTWRALKHLGVKNPSLEKVLPDLVASTVQRLARQQNLDGGWGWWAKDKSNSFLTAYALWALTQAEDAGFDVPVEMMRRAGAFLDKTLKTSKPTKDHWRNNRVAMITFALAAYASQNGSTFPDLYPAAVRLFQRRENLDQYGKALLGLAFGVFSENQAVGAEARKASRTYLQAILSELERSAVLDPTGAHWEEQTVDWWNMNNDIRSTAIVLMLMARYDVKNPLAPNAVRWLMASRRGDRWTHTQDTAWAVVALTDWMEQTGELQPDYDYTAWLNGVVWLQGTMTVSDVRKTQTATVPVADLKQGEPNWIRIDRKGSSGTSGTGALYYRLLLKTYKPLKDLTPESRGVAVERWYTVGDDKTPVREAHVGDLITVHLRLIASRGLQYLLLEDPLPAGVEPVEVRLRTTSSEARGPRTKGPSPNPSWWHWWYWSPTHVDLRDDRAGIFQTYLSAGTYEVTYQVRASIPGTFIVGPATARQMYSPEVFGRTGSEMFRVLPEQ